jgi:ethanolamine transporter EutH
MEIFDSLKILLIAVVCNILCGAYYNVSVKDIKFDWIKLLNGVIKALIVGIIAVGMSYVFSQMTELTEAIGITPMMIMNSAIILYVGKTLVGLGKILGVNVEVKS